MFCSSGKATQDRKRRSSRKTADFLEASSCVLEVSPGTVWRKHSSESIGSDDRSPIDCVAGARPCWNPSNPEGALQSRLWSDLPGAFNNPTIALLGKRCSEVTFLMMS